MIGGGSARCPFCGRGAPSEAVSCQSCGAERLPGFGERWFLPLTIFCALALFFAQVFAFLALAEALQPEASFARASRIATAAAMLGSALLTRFGGRRWTAFLLAPRRRDVWRLRSETRRGL